MMLDWKSEGEELPRIGETILLAHPRQACDFWGIATACLLARHEDVIPLPVKAGGRWPSDYYWALDRHNRSSVLVTGNAWWARLDGIPLPPAAAHRTINGFHCIVQLGEVFIPQGRGR